MGQKRPTRWRCGRGSVVVRCFSEKRLNGDARFGLGSRTGLGDRVVFLDRVAYCPLQYALRSPTMNRVEMESSLSSSCSKCSRRVHQGIPELESDITDFGRGQGRIRQTSHARMMDRMILIPWTTGRLSHSLSLRSPRAWTDSGSLDVPEVWSRGVITGPVNGS